MAFKFNDSALPAANLAPYEKSCDAAVDGIHLSGTNVRSTLATFVFVKV